MEQTEKEIIDRVMKLKKSYEEATKEQRAEITDIYNAYMGKMENVKNLPYKSKETIPKLRTEISYVKPAIFSGEPEIQVEGVGDEDKAIAQILEKIVNYRIQQSIPDAYGKIEDWVHQAVTFGTSLLKVVWRFETEDVNEPQEDGTQSTYQKVVRDEPDFEVPNILDTFKNPLIADVSGQPCIIFRSILPIDDVKENPMYDYVGEDGTPNREKITSSGVKAINIYDSSQLTTTDLPSSQEKATEGMVEIFELVDDDKIQTIANGTQQVVLRDTQNVYGFINAVKFVFEKNTIPNRFDGLGVGNDTLGLGKMYYQMFNQTLENVKLVNNPMFLFAKGLGVDTRQLVAKPGGGISIDAKGQPLSNSIQPILFPDIKQGAVELLNKMEDEHKRASGANDLLQGSASNNTLGQDQLAQTNISQRFELIQRRFKHALADVADMLIKMELKNLQSPEADILRIFPQELRGQIYQILISQAQDVKYNITIKGDTTVARNKQLESKRLVDLFDLSQNFLTDQEKRSFLRRIAERQGENNIDEIIAVNNPIADQQEQMNAMQGQMTPGQKPEGQYNQVGQNYAQ